MKPSVQSAITYIDGEKGILQYRGIPIDELAGRTRAVLSTVGPYQLYGSGLVAACAAAGTDYVDLCGEPIWMKEMIERHQAVARRSGARIVFACGFDSVPSDLGVHILQQVAVERFGRPASRV